MRQAHRPRFALKSLFAATLACYAPPLLANPSGASVVSGTVSFEQQGNNLIITNSAGAIINWQSFSIGADELTRFVQASSSSAVLNRVTGQDPSQILGQLQSNGRVFLVNPNGIVFGEGAQVDVAGLLASTLDISDEDFQAGKLRFAGSSTASLSNAASITTPSGGFVYLIAPTVENSGVIVSPDGEILLAAGSSVELVDGVDTSLRVQISAPAGEVLNVGQLIASQGRIGIFAAAIRQQGLVSATRAEVGAGGEIVFKASGDIELAANSQTEASGGGSLLVEAGGATSLAGSIDVSNASGVGGSVQLLGETVSVSGSVAAGGETGGGTILVGGDYQGSNAAVKNASQTWLSSSASLDASAGSSGDGGTIIVWSDAVTVANGSISARGGSNGGDGGFVEVSGKRYLGFNVAVDLGASAGELGTLLLDPENLIIASSCSSDCLVSLPVSLGDGAATSTILAAVLDAAVADIVLNASADIVFEASVSTTQALTAIAGANIVVNAALSSTGSISLSAGDTLTVNQGISSANNILSLDASSIVLNGGTLYSTVDVNLTAGSGGISQADGASVLAGSLNIVSAGDVSLASVAGSSGALSLNASLSGSEARSFSLAGSGDLSIEQVDWAGQMALDISNGAIYQGGSSSLNVAELSLWTTGSSGSSHYIDLSSGSNTIGSLNATVACPDGYCYDGISVYTGSSLTVGDSGIINEGQGSIRLYAHGDLLLGNGDISASTVELVADGGTLGYASSSASAVVWADTLNLQRLSSEGYLNYSGSVGSAEQPLQFAAWSSGSSGAETRVSTSSGTVTLGLGSNGAANIDNAYLSSASNVYLEALGLSSSASLALSATGSLALSSDIGSISTSGDLSLAALGEGSSLVLDDLRSLDAANIELVSEGSLSLSQISAVASELLTISASDFSLSGSSAGSQASLSAGAALTLSADAIWIDEGVTLSAPSVTLATLGSSTAMLLGGDDSSGVLGLSSSELAAISTDSLQLQSGGDLNVDTAVSASSLSLLSGGSINGSGLLSASQLELTATGSLGNSESYLQASAASIVASTTGSSAAIYLATSSAGELTASSLGGTIALSLAGGSSVAASSAGGAIELRSAGSLQLQDIDAGSGSLMVSASEIEALAGSLASAASMELSASEAIGATGALQLSTGQLSTGQLTVSNSGSGGIALTTSGGLSSLVLSAAGGAVVLDIGGALSASLSLSEVSSLDLSSAGSLVLSGDTISAGTIDIYSSGDLQADANLSASQGLSLSSSAGSISGSGVLSAGLLTLSAASGLGNGESYLQAAAASIVASSSGSSAAIYLATSSAGNVSASSQGAAIILALAGDSSVAASSAGGAIDLSSAGSLSLNDVDAGSGGLTVQTGAALNLDGAISAAQMDLVAAGSVSVAGALSATGSLGLGGAEIVAAGGSLAADSVLLSSSGAIGGGSALQLQANTLVASTSSDSATVWLAGEIASAELSSQGGTLHLDLQGSSTVDADAGSGLVDVSSSGSLTGSFRGDSVLLSAGRSLGDAEERVQVDALSAELVAAGNLYVDGSERLASVSIANSGELSDFYGQTSYSATVSAPSGSVLLGGVADIGLLSVQGLSVQVIAPGSIRGVGEGTHLGASEADLQAGGDIDLQTALGTLSLQSGGNVDLRNLGSLFLSSAAVSGNLTINNQGSLDTVGLVEAGGLVDLSAHSPLTIGSGGISAGTGVVLATTASESGNDDISVLGDIRTAQGSCDISAAGSISQTGSISTGGGAISLLAAGGNIVMGEIAQSLSQGGQISYRALGSLALALLDADEGKVALSADTGSIGSVLEGAVNVRALALNASSAGDMALWVDVPVANVALTVGGLMDVRDALGRPLFVSQTKVDAVLSDTVQAANASTAGLGGSNSVDQQVQQNTNSGQGEQDGKTKKIRKC